MSRTITPPDQTSDPIQFTSIAFETALCLVCADHPEIPKECIITQFVPPKTYEAMRQRVRAFCPHCESMFELQRVLRGGVYQVDGEVEIVKDKKRRSAFIHRLDEQRGIHRQPA